MSDDAVSDVVGNVLLVGITVAVMSGLSVAVFLIGGPADVLHVDFDVDVVRGGDAWGEGDEQVRLQHVGGEPVPTGIEVRITLNGTTTSHTPNDQGFSDGLFQMGESWSTTMTIPKDAEVSVTIIDPDNQALVAATGILLGATSTTGPSTGGGAGGPANTTYTYVDSGQAILGNLTGFALAQSADDAGASALLQEGSFPGSPILETQDPAQVTASVGLANPDRVLASDNSRATFAAFGDVVEVEGFSVPVGATITDVRVGFEARHGGGGQNPSLLLEYSVNGTLGTTSESHTVSSGSDTTYGLMDITPDRTWTPSDMAGLRLHLARTSLDAGYRDANVDHLFVQVTYTLVATELEATFDFVGVPAGLTQTLQVRFATSTDTFGIQVWNGATWSPPQPLNSTAPATYVYPLNLLEYNLGAPRVRFVDLDSAPGEGTLQIDYARVVTT